MVSYELFGRTRNGTAVFIQPGQTHAATHFTDSPRLSALVKVALPRITATAKNVQTDYDFGKAIGDTDLLSTNANDVIVYAKRLHRKTYARFAKHRRPVKTSHITVVLQKIDKGYLLISAWIGPSVPPFPGDRRKWSDSKAFWEHHALVYGRQSIDESSVTDICPW
jgi:hypothetical protein